MKRILAIEDDLSLANLISYNLEQAGYKVANAFDGGVALHTLESSCPHLVTLDLLLPQQNGWQVLHAIRCHPRKEVA